jgi:glutaredoxin 3
MAAQTFVQQAIAKSPVTLFTKASCPYCNKIKQVLNGQKVKFDDYSIETRSDIAEVQDYLQQITGARTVPRVFIGGKSVGGCDDTVKLVEQGKLIQMVKAAGGQVA